MNREAVRSPVCEANDVRLLPSFLQQQLAARGLDGIAERVAAALPLTEGEAARLLTLSFPLLGALVECRKAASIHAKTLPAMQPTIAVPFVQRWESQGLESALADSVRQLETVRGAHRLTGETFISLDRWKSAQPVHLFVEALLELLSRSGLSGPVRIHGPSTGELRALLTSCALTAPSESDTPSSESDTPGAAIPPLLRPLLSPSRITGIEGGSDRALYRLAAANQIPVIFSHSITKARVLPQSESPQSRTADRSEQQGEQFLRELFELREDLLASGQLAGWSPWSPVLLDRAAPKESAPLGLELVRSVAVARLILPEVEVIRAPAVLFGAKLAHLALLCGANDLGPVAVDLETAAQTGLLHRADVLAEFFADDQETLS